MEPKRILIVEDDPGHAELIIRGIDKNSPGIYNLFHVTTLLDARIALNDFRPDLMLVDWRLYDGDGISLVQRDSHGHPMHPIIIMTSFGNESIAVEAIKAGALDYIVKSAASFRDMDHSIERALREWGHIRAHKRAEEKLAESHKKLKDAYESTLEGWSLALNLRDRNTEEHTRRSVEKTMIILQNLGIFSDKELQYARWGALLHDIGKIAVPDHILLKPGSLDEGEWEIMRKHPEYARDMLLSIEYLRPAVDIPYCHHERWDGAGYPQGLHEQEIPVCARVFSIVDVWDALSSDRPYRKAWAPEAVRDYILQNAGTYFDPEIVEMIDRLNLLW